MKESVTFVEINLFDQMLPLTSGYLQSYACQNSEIVDSFSFIKYSTTVHETDESILNDILKNESRIYALSCYLWNIKLMMRIAQRIVEEHPDSYVLMGGPQVMHHGHQYLDANYKNMMICNGEGEITFSKFLSELLTADPDFSNVKGLTFYNEGNLTTTEPQPRLKSLDEIPSPYTTGVFDGNYRFAVMETNRGCPFRCTYCYWGAATNDKVHKFDENRIRDEIFWLGENQVPILFLADANWGMSKRDINLSNHIADSKTKFGMPFYVYFSAAKNSPGRVSEIANVFDKAGMMNVQPVSLQTMDKTALETVERSNIKSEAYQTLQNELNDKGIGSYIELIWPLPGETLSSFKQGIGDLCEMNAAYLTAYPNILLHNTPMYHQRDELDIVTRVVSDHASEAELIVGTKQVTYDDFKEGLSYFYGVLALYNTQALARCAKWLHANKIMTYKELFETFVVFCQNAPSNEFTSFCQDSISNDKYHEIPNYPTVFHLTLHSHRSEFDDLLFAFGSQQSWWDNEDARFLFELDVLTKLYLYSNTPIRDVNFLLKFIEIKEIRDRTIVAQVPEKFLWHLNEDEVHTDGTITLNHSREQFPFSESTSREENAQYCIGRIHMIRAHLPQWESPTPA